MAVRQFWPATKLGWLNFCLCVLVLAAGTRYHQELQWAWYQIKDYRQGNIENPLERELYINAERLLYEDKRPDAAIPLLRESIGIDPNTEAVFLLAESYKATGELQRAAQEYERFLSIDYLHIEARLALIDTYRRLGRPDLAKQQAGIAVLVFDDMVRRYNPKTDGTVAKRFNSRASLVYKHYIKAWRLFQRLAQLEWRQREGKGHVEEAQR